LYTKKSHIAAHIIVGARPEPFLPALLASLDGVVDALLVNENSGLSTSENLLVLQASSFAQRQMLRIDHTPFENFAAARNICLRMHAEEAEPAEWVAFVDADEVHCSTAKSIAQHLNAVPATINFVDGYTYHFFQSFDWYMSIERRMSFHRFTPMIYWDGAVHEQLRGLEDTRIALPYVYMHYGHVLSARRHAEKELQYAALGRPGDTPPPPTIEEIERQSYFAQFWPRLMRFHGQHPQTAQMVIEQLRSSMAQEFAETERYIQARANTLSAVATRAYWRFNYDLRWRSRELNSIARKLCH
jgi:hypothetical protein